MIHRSFHKPTATLVLILSFAYLRRAKCTANMRTIKSIRVSLWAYGKTGGSLSCWTPIPSVELRRIGTWWNRCRPTWCPSFPIGHILAKRNRGAISIPRKNAEAFRTSQSIMDPAILPRVAYGRSSHRCAMRVRSVRAFTLK